MRLSANLRRLLEACPGPCRDAALADGAVCLRGVVDDERRLAAAVGKGVFEPIERNAETDQLLEGAGELPPRAVERLDAGHPIVAVRVDAAEEHAVLQHRVDADHVVLDARLSRTAVDSEQACDAAPREQ